MSHLTVRLAGDDAARALVDDVGFSVGRGECLGIVGESGSGKSLTCLGVMGLLPPAVQMTGGAIRLRGEDLRRLPPARLRSLLGREMAYIPQDPTQALNPVLNIGQQIAEGIRQHVRPDREGLRRRMAEALELVRLPADEALLHRFPHELSGGMRQRAAAAAALACDPALLIADEPTTALDPTLQVQFLALLRGAQARLGIAMVFVTHDFGIIGAVADRVVVMYAGRIVETAPLEALFERPVHPYTRALLNCVPSLDGPVQRLVSIPGAPPSPSEALSGCAFAPRCPVAEARCVEAAPQPVTISEEHWASCWKA